MKRKTTFLFAILLVLSSVATAQEREDIPLRIYNCAINGNTKSIEKGSDFELYINFENWQKKETGAIEVSISVPKSVHIISNSTPQIINNLPYNHTQAVYYVINIPNSYTSTTIPIEVFISNFDGVLTKCYSIDLSIGQNFGNVAFVSLPNTSNNLSSQQNNIETRTSRYRVSTNKLNVRSLPSTRSSILGQLSNMEYVEVYNITDGWAEIEFMGERSYISEKYIVPAPNNEVKPISIEKKDSTEATVIVVDERSPQTNTQQLKASNSWNLSFFPTISIGLSNLFSFDASSSPKFAFGIGGGTQFAKSFHSGQILMEMTLSFLLLGNDHYSFPSFNIELLPLGYRFGVKGRYLYVLAGPSLQIPLGGGIHFSRNSQYYSFDAQTSLSLILKTGYEVNERIILGAYYLHGLNDVCSNLPIGLKHESFQLFCAVKIGKL